MISVQRMAISLKKGRKCEIDHWFYSIQAFWGTNIRIMQNIDRYQCQKSAALTRKFDFFSTRKQLRKKHPKHPKNRDSQSPFGGEDWHDWPSWLVDVGGIPTPLKNISQLGWLSPIYGKSKIHVPNHQPQRCHFLGFCTPIRFNNEKSINQSKV